MANRNTQEVTEAFQVGGNPKARETQLVTEAFQVGGNPNARDTQIVVEAFIRLSLPPNPGKKPQPIIFVVT